MNDSNVTELAGFQKFCGGKFWDVNLTWYTSVPRFTECFQTTALAWAPCVFLWVVLPFYSYYLSKLTDPPTPVTKLNTAKTVLGIVQIFVVLLDIVKTASEVAREDAPPLALLVTPTVLTLTLIVSVALVQVERRKGFITSGIQFLFWLLLFVTGIVPFYSKILDATDLGHVEGIFRFVTFYVFYAIVIVQLILTFFSDTLPTPRITCGKAPCPEVKASFPSRLVYWWINGLVLLGYKQTLTANDLWSLHPRDVTKTHSPRFQEAWEYELEKTNWFGDKKKRKASAYTRNLSAASRQASRLDPSEQSKLTDNHHAGYGSGEKTPLLADVELDDAADVTVRDPKKKKEPSLTWALCKVYGPTMLLAWACKLVYDVLTFVGPMLQSQLIAYTEDRSVETWKGYLYASLFFVNGIVSSVFFHQLFHIGMTLGMRVKSAVIAAVYRKALMLSNESRKETTVGEIVNLMSVDAQRLQDVTGYLWMVWSSPLQIAIAVYMLWGIVGPSVLAGLAVMVLLIPINGILATIQRNLQIAQMTQKDKRIKLMNEVLNGMKVLKLYAWELSFKDKISAIRNVELETLRKYAYLSAFGTFTWTCAPFLVIIATFVTFVATGHTLDATTAFVSLSLFNILRFPMLALPMLMAYMVTVVVTTFATFTLTGNVLDAGTAFVSLSLFNILRFPINLFPMVVSYIVTVTISTFTSFVLTGNPLTADTAFVSLSLFNILRFPMNIFPMMIAYLITVTLATYATWVLTGHPLDADTAFVSLSLFNILRFPINLLPMMVSYLVTASVSIKRLGKFLRNKDLDLENVSHIAGSKYPISITNGTFAWGTGADDLTILDQVNLDVSEGELIAVVGPVGCGKSSLISAMLGEMEKLQGKVNVRSKLAYVAQQAWIQNATLKDNILFGKPFNATKYERILDQCALKPDLEILPGGDQVEIGEKGINLSGGQKQRVALARAVYNDADVYLLDDPLSAVDSHVGKHIFEQVLGDKGALSNKTRLLVTHGVQWLPLVDRIAVIADGQISEIGSYDELLTHNGPFAQFLKTFLLKEDSDDSDSEDPEIAELKLKMMERVDSIQPEVTTDATSGGEGAGAGAGDVSDSGASSSSLQRRISRKKSTPDRAMSRKKSVAKRVSVVEPPKKPGEPAAGEKLIQEEKSQEGGVRWSVFLRYTSALGSIYVLLIAFFFLLYQLASVLSSIWLSEWTEDPLLKNSSIPTNGSEYQNKQNMYLGVYGALGGAQALFVLFYALISAASMVRASRKLHMTMLYNILRSPMSFFDTTPIGRILNRFSRDIETIDNILPNLLRSWINNFFLVISTIVVISYSTPIFLTVVIPLGLLYYFIQRFYIPTSRQLKRIESTTRSPIYTHFSETITGASTIRAYAEQRRFIDRSDELVDHNLVFYFSSIASNRWLGFRLEFVGSAVVLAAAIFAVAGRDTLSGGLVGLSISYALQVTQSLNWMVRMTSDLETNVVSVERVIEYSETPQEREWYDDATRPRRGWPDEGKVAFENYSTRYREGLDLVLRGIDADVKAGEKIGIVGRTGAGKSSLTLALFRIIEAAGGAITIDGVHIGDLGLHQLRSKITILPQDPVLFSGSLRMNLDPFDRYSDSEIWQALELSHLKDFVSSLPAGLNYECGEGGQNLSVGQRQLVCLARTLLRKTKILILDEATAAVDLETDELIQNTIRQEFADCTILTIAHRLNTILDSDRVMVLDQGKIVEFNDPNTLLKDKNSLFYGMAKDANIV